MAAEQVTQKSNVPIWVYVTLVIGLILSLIGVAFMVFAPKRDHLTSVAEGVVSRVEVKETTRKGRDRRSYITFVRFEDSDHRTFEARSVVNGSTKRHNEGDVVTVHFDPRDPEAGCFIEGDEDRLVMNVILEKVCQIGGPVTLLVGAAAFLVFKRKAAVA